MQFQKNCTIIYELLVPPTLDGAGQMHILLMVQIGCFVSHLPLFSDDVYTFYFQCSEYLPASNIPYLH